MPYKEFKIEKLYYTIGEVAEMLEESTSLVRFGPKNSRNLLNRQETKRVIGYSQLRMWQILKPFTTWLRREE